MGRWDIYQRTVENIEELAGQCGGSLDPGSTELSCASSRSLLFALAVKAFPVSSSPPAVGSHHWCPQSPVERACDSNVLARWGEVLHVIES